MVFYAIFIGCLVSFFRSVHGDGHDCPGLQGQGVFNQTFRIPNMEVPAKETTYMCSHFEFPSGPNHLIGFKPAIQNRNFPHHIVIYGCVNTQRVPNFGVPYECNMEGDDCTQIILAWSLGDEAFCLPDNVGFRVGDGGFTYGLLEIHWNNPAKVSGQEDNSGLNLYMTPNLRENEAGILTIGQQQLEIPYNQTHEENAMCSPYCTNKILTGPVNVFGVFNHMHTSGTSARTMVVTPENRAYYLGIDDMYDYNRPMVHVYNEPVILNPGDSIKLSCHYKTPARTSTTFYGLSTQDEMCFSFVMYYPKANMNRPGCLSWKGLDMCQIDEGGVNGCQFDKLETDPQLLKMYADLYTHCSMTTCLKECKVFIKEMQKHPCFRPDIMDFLKWHSNYTDVTHIQVQLLSRSCDVELMQERLEMQYMNRDTSAATGFTGSYVSVMAGIVLLFVSRIFM